MKLQIFLRTFWAPIVLLGILFIRLGYSYTAFEIFVAIVFLASILFSRLLSDIRYIQHLTITGDKIIIRYINQFLTGKTLELSLGSITGLSMSKKRRIPLWPPTIEFKLNNDRFVFNILSSELYDAIQHQMTAANLNPIQNHLATQ